MEHGWFIVIMVISQFANCECLPGRVASNIYLYPLLRQASFKVSQTKDLHPHRPRIARKFRSKDLELEELHEARTPQLTFDLRPYLTGPNFHRFAPDLLLPTSPTTLRCSFCRCHRTVRAWHCATIVGCGDLAEFPEHLPRSGAGGTSHGPPMTMMNHITGGGSPPKTGTLLKSVMDHYTDIVGL